jgi:hypothetical protein
MRRLRQVILAVAVGSAAAVGLSGCPAAHDAFPSRACATDKDCYVGEKCMNASMCVTDTSPDLSVPVESTDMAEPLPGGDS